MNGSFGFQQFFSNDQNESQKVSQVFSLLMCDDVLISFTERVESIDPFNRKIIETCSKGFELKVATLRLKTPLKMKENFIGNRTITKETKTNADPS